jgi:hypothetical protein
MSQKKCEGLVTAAFASESWRFNPLMDVSHIIDNFVKALKGFFELKKFGCDIDTT